MILEEKNDKKRKDIGVQYVIKSPKLREIINLKNHEPGIKQAVFDICGPKINVEVEEQCFILDKEPSSEEARLIGRRISLYCPDISKHKKTYHSKGCDGGVSNQLFIRKR